MALSKEEKIKLWAAEFHISLNGKRRYKYWPEVDKKVADIGVCETSLTHEFDSQVIKLKGRRYDLELNICKKCPLSLVAPLPNV